MAAQDVLLRIRGDSTSAVSSLRNVGDEADKLDRRARTAGDGTSTLGGHIKTMDGKATAAAVSVAKLGLAAAAGAAGIGALTYALTDGFGAAEEKMRLWAVTNQVIKSTGAAAGVTTADINNMANSLEELTAVDDAMILSGENMLLSFTNIQNKAGEGNDVFNQATSTMLDLAVFMGSDTATAAMQLGKALNDPVEGVAALQRVGVKLTPVQKDMVQAFMDVGDVASAQKVILGELNREFGGVAKAVGDQSPWTKLKLSLGNITESLGFALMPMLRGAAKYVQTKVVPAFSEWGGWMQTIWNGSGTGAEKLQASWDTFDDLLIKLGMSEDDAADLKTKFEEVGNAVKDIAGFVRDTTTAIRENWDIAKPILEALATAWVVVKTQALLAAVAQALGVGAAGGAGGAAAAGAGGAAAGAGAGKLAGALGFLKGMVGVAGVGYLTGEASKDHANTGELINQDYIDSQKGRQVESITSFDWYLNSVRNKAFQNAPRLNSAGHFNFGSQGFRGGQEAEQPQSVNSFRGLLGTLANSHLPFIGRFAAGAGSLMDAFGQGMDSKKTWLQTVVEGILGFVKGFFGGSLPEWGPLAGGTSMFLGGQALIQKFGEGLHTGSKFVTDILNSITARFAGMMGGLGVAQWIPTVLKAMAITGTPLYYLPHILAQMQTESGGNPWNPNTWDSNAAAGNATADLMQNIPSAYQSRLAGTGYEGLPYGDPLGSLIASMNYVKGTYGGDWSVVGAPNHTRGYLYGGISVTPGLAAVSERGDPELHLTNASIKKHFPMLGNGGLTINIHGDIITPNPADFARKLGRQIVLKTSPSLGAAF